MHRNRPSPVRMYRSSPPNVLLLRLQRNFGLNDAVLRWFTSFVTGRTQQILFDGHLSPVMPVLYGVPQGSVLGPLGLLFVMYTADLSRVVMQHGLLLHQYADDCQVYLSSTVNDASILVDRFARCIEDLDAWLSASRLRLNPTKTQVLWLGSRYLVDKITVRHVPVLLHQSRSSTRPATSVS